ncbi:MAG: capsular polysaccharide biosynthesis protein [Paracoccaceae bacterium]|nr:MAG: capsular biosynthesis protein [Alphaproteobacteria bacterium]GIX12476.1 MAG: capsular polysaccharide biosynthesis protein [Paracoccaceae bacterium]
MAPKKCFLFLQGPPGLFWARLADALAAAGHGVRRINLNAGDRLFWPRRGADNYRGRLSAWRDWLDAYCARHGVTDILYYADRQPYHVEALAVARARGLRAHAVEYGYLRPDWITIEPEGMGRHSTFPRTPAAIRALAAGQPDPDMTPRHGHAFIDEAWREVAYSLAMVFGRPLYPFYRSDRYYWPVAEYLAWAIRLGLRPIALGRGEALVDRCLSGAFPFNVVALQLQMDYQIRASTDYGHLEEMLDEVMASMAAHAPADRHLVVKTHPLDCGLELWPLRLRRLTRRHGLRGRVHLVESRRLAPLVRASRGVILANSTVGLHALGDGVPVLAMGDAIYDIPGLTHQGGIDSFWTDPEPVDMGLVADLRRALAAHIQVRGDFFDPEGQRAAIAALVARLTA